MKRALIRFSSSILNALVFHNIVKLPYLNILASFRKSSGDFQVDAEHLKDKTLCFLLGSPRSGTTLSSILLDYTDNIACPPELYLATFDDMAQRKEMMGQTIYKSLTLGLAQALSRVNRTSLVSSHAMAKDAEKKNLSTAEIYNYFLARSESVFVDKTPCYLSYVSDELFCSRYPMAKYIYVYRHPLAVIQSLKSQIDSLSDEQFKKFGMKASEMHRQGKIGLFAMAFAKREAFTEFQDYKMEAQKKFDFDKFKILESWWYYENLRTIEFLKGIPEDQKFVYSFESLVKDPVKTLSGLYAFLGIDSDPRSAISTYENEKAPDTVGTILAAFWNWEIGDPNQIFMRGKIEPSRANEWKKHSHLWDRLEAETQQLAIQMGYESC
ncbi:MAG: sulfotransferase [Pseudomonadota bacterium]|nr:sulfotransferase [Pseudomonadota bacterium]